jgi:transcriptional regulator with XRE-family HTH domain
MSQEKLAEKAELHPKYISEVERGQKTISVDAMARIARALGLNVSDLTRGF